MVKKTFLVVACAFLLSGCTITLPFQGAAPAAESGDTDGTFGQKVEKGSVWKSTDGGQTFFVHSRVDEKQTITKADVLALSFHPKDHNTIYIGTVDHGIFKTTDGGEYWEQIPFPPKKIYSFILDKHHPDERMFASGTFGSLGKIYRTKDGGANWESVYTEPGQKVTITILAQHPRDTNVLFAGTSAGTIIKSTDSGDTWKNVGNAIDGPIIDIVFDAEQPLSIYTLSLGKKAYYSFDGGLSWLDWEEVKRKESAGKTLSEEAQRKEREEKMPDGLLSITADPSITGRLYGSKNGGLYRSDDYGKYWKKINIIESAETFPVRSLAINPHDSNEMIFAAGSAFYRSSNLGDTWAVVDLYTDRGISILAYDPEDPKVMYLGLRKF